MFLEIETLLHIPFFSFLSVISNPSRSWYTPLHCLQASNRGVPAAMSKKTLFLVSHRAIRGNAMVGAGDAHDDQRDKTRSRQPSQDEGSRLLGEPDDGGDFCSRVKLKVSLCLGTTAALSFMVFLFLVPFVVDPAVSRLIARYSPEPGTCALHEHVFNAGLSKCMWSSCREGCTSATTRCHQITVNYSLTPYQKYEQASAHRYYNITYLHILSVNTLQGFLKSFQTYGVV